MAASQIKVLLDELAAILAEMGALDEGATDALDPDGNEAEVVVESNADMKDEDEDEDEEMLRQENPVEDEEEDEEDEEMAKARSMDRLMKRAEKIKAKIDFYERKAAKESELRSVLERAAPAKRLASNKVVYAVPKGHGNLRAFRGPNAEERAYRAGMHIRGYIFGDAEARRWCVDHNVESRAQAGGINALGGTLTSDEMATEIIRLVEEFGVFPQYARRVNMNSDTLVIARRRSGLAARPVGENVEILDSAAEFDNVQLVAKIWGVANRIPNSLLEDSVIDLADAMAVEASQAFAEAFDGAGFVGDGSGIYHGTVGAATAIVDGTHNAGVITAKTGGVSFDTVDISDFTRLIAKLPLYSKRNAAFYISPTGYGAAMTRLAIVPNVGSVGGGGNTRGDVGEGYNTLKFLGFPVVLVHPMEDGLTGTQNKVACLFGDLSQAATFGERRAITIQTARERYIEFDQTLIHSVTRNAMVVHDLGDNSKPGPLVALKFAAS